MKDVVVTGVGAITPLGVGADASYDRWRAGEVGITGGEAPCSDFETLDFFTRKEAPRGVRFTQFARAAAQEALEQSGELPYEPGRIGCVLGTGIGGLGTLEAGFGALHDEGPEKGAPVSGSLVVGH